jgi:starch synthase
MPSRVEPCGLNQLYSLRYGTMPIVNTTGGLKDTVIDFELPDGYGICFLNTDEASVVEALNRAVELFANNTLLEELQQKMMSLDFSWDKSAKQYIALYKTLTKL